MRGGYREGCVSPDDRSAKAATESSTRIAILMLVATAPRVLVRQRRVPRLLFGATGLLFVGLGTVGLFVPVWPSTIFFILALWAFKRSSERLEDWLLRHPVIGPTLRDWDENRWLRARTKLVAVTLLWACLILSMAIVRKPLVYWILPATGLAVTIYVLTRPTKPEGARATPPSAAQPPDLQGL